MSRPNVTLSEIVHAYQRTKLAQSESLELELRFPHEKGDEWKNIWRAAYTRILQRYLESDKSWTTRTEASTRVISKLTNRIYQVEYQGAKRQAVGLVKRHLLNKYHEGIKVSLSSETLGDANKFSDVVSDINNIMVRLRMRVSFQLPELPGWWVDFTYVASTDVPNQIRDFLDKEMKHFMPKGPLTPESFLDALTAGPNRDAEIELEYIPEVDKIQGERLSEASLRQTINEFRQIVKPLDDAQRDYHRVIRWLAKQLRREDLKSNSTLKQISNNPINLSHKKYLELRSQVGDYFLTDKTDGDRGFLVICPVEKWPLEVEGGKEDEEEDAEAEEEDEPDVEAEEEENEDNTGDEAEDESSGLEILEVEGGDEETEETEEPKAATKKLEPTQCVVALITSTLTLLPSIKYPGELTLIDLEHVSGTLYAFDLLIHNSRDLTRATYIERHLHLTEVVSQLTKLEQKSLKVLLKEQLRLNPAEFPAQLKQVYKAKRPYQIDGLIFTHAKHPYWEKEAVYKWKPADHLTIDFLIMRAPVSLMNSSPYLPKPGHTLYLLFCGISHTKREQYGLSLLPSHREMFHNFGGTGRMIPIQFTTPTHKLAYLYYHEETAKKAKAPAKKTLHKEGEIVDPLHGHVGEFLWNPQRRGAETPGMVPWQLVRLRTDKDANVQDGIAYGNSYSTALSTFNDILHPLSLEEMMSGEVVAEDSDNETGYFAKSKGRDYRGLTHYNNFAKAQVLQQLQGANFVIDLMCGQGQDLFKFIGWQVKNLIAVDKDSKALQELRNRYLKIDDPAWWRAYPPKPNQITFKLSTLEYDLSNLTKLPQRLISERMINAPTTSADNRVEGIVCNLGLHYILESEVSLKNLIKFLDQSLKVGGRFIYTSFHGNLVHQMLSGLKKGESWNSEKGKYSIRKEYTAKEMGFGHKIAVLHPFSDGEYYEENLLDIESIKEALESAGYWQIGHGSFQDYWPRYEQMGWSGRLQNEDRFYSSLYQYSAFMRI